MSSANRDTICLEQARIINNTVFPGQQFVLRLESPRCAARAEPGTFVHVQCSPELPMRRPLSIMRADPEAGWIELLYKIVGAGLSDLARAAPGQELSVLGPIGKGFAPDTRRPIVALIGGGVGIPPLVYLAEWLYRHEQAWQPVALFGSELPFPFEMSDHALPMPGIGSDDQQTLALLNKWQTPGRLASLSDIAGSFRGYVTDLARQWLAALDAEERSRVMICACGPTAMLTATAELAREFDLPSQLCLEEYMACAVGGCAGCTVRVRTPDGPTMQRVCVDGPVFDGSTVF